MACRRLQEHRFSSQRDIRTNSEMTPKAMREFCKVGEDCASLLEQAMEQLHFSARAYDRILKVARTIADLDESIDLEAEHVLEAIQFRSLDRQLCFS